MSREEQQMVWSVRAAWAFAALTTVIACVVSVIAGNALLAAAIVVLNVLSVFKLRRLFATSRVERSKP